MAGTAATDAALGRERITAQWKSSRHATPSSLAGTRPGFQDIPSIASPPLGAQHKFPGCAANPADRYRRIATRSGFSNGEIQREDR